MFGRFRGTKIITTLGPAADRDDNLEKVIATGIDVVHMNFSYGSSENHKMCADKVREIAAGLGRHVAILGDLQGPEIRVSTLKEGKVFLNVGDRFLLDANLSKGEGDKEEVGIDYKGLPADVVSGDILLLDDGRVQLRVLGAQGMKVLARVTVGGPLPNDKGINRLNGGLSTGALTEKGKADIRTAALIGVDYLAVSFPRCDEDLNYARRLTYDARCDAKIIAKVERAEAVCDQDTVNGIILASDVVMVARGDPGVEISDPELTDIQKASIRRVRQLNRAVIMAAQMMESMITSPMPTRTGIVDVTNAVLDGTDAMMLSAETAAGQYPSKTVAAMARVCLGTEEIPNINASRHRLGVRFDNMEKVITMLTMYAANHLRSITAIIAMTESGRTALVTSRISSGLPIFVMSHHRHTLNLTALYHGVTSMHFDSTNNSVTVTNKAVDLLRDRGYLMSGDLVIVTRGDVINTVGSASTTRILTVE